MEKIINKFLRRLYPSLQLYNCNDYFLIKKNRRKKDLINAILQGDIILNCVRNETCYTPSTNIMDFGCGDGCFAASLTRNFHKGKYYGIDINKSWIEQLNKLHKSRKNFHFEYSDTHHSYYNPEGTVNAIEYHLPKIENIDLLIFNSIFSHMDLPIIEHYLSEAVEVISSKGQIWCTMFVKDGSLNPNELSASDYYKSLDKEFTPHGKGYTLTKRNPEEFLVFDKDAVINIFNKLNLKIIRFSEGCWKKPQNHPLQHRQDTFLLRYSKV